MAFIEGWPHVRGGLIEGCHHVRGGLYEGFHCNADGTNVTKYSQNEFQYAESK